MKKKPSNTRIFTLLLGKCASTNCVRGSESQASGVAEVVLLLKRVKGSKAHGAKGSISSSTEEAKLDQALLGAASSLAIARDALLIGSAVGRRSIVLLRLRITGLLGSANGSVGSIASQAAHRATVVLAQERVQGRKAHGAKGTVSGSAEVAELDQGLLSALGKVAVTSGAVITGGRVLGSDSNGLLARGLSSASIAVGGVNKAGNVGLSPRVSVLRIATVISSSENSAVVDGVTRGSRVLVSNNVLNLGQIQKLRDGQELESLLQERVEHLGHSGDSSRLNVVRQHDGTRASIVDEALSNHIGARALPVLRINVPGKKKKALNKNLSFETSTSPFLPDDRLKVVGSADKSVQGRRRSSVRGSEQARPLSSNGTDDIGGINNLVVQLAARHLGDERVSPRVVSNLKGEEKINV